MRNPAVRPADILLPAPEIAPETWAVVAVDQFTSQPDYWQRAEEIVGGAPSALRLVLPEVYLSQSDVRIPEMQRAMRDYLDRGVLRTGVRNGFLLVERATAAGNRLGLMACLDLEQYDFSASSQSLIRATEGTVLERVPPRVKIRRGAPVELPHVLMLLDDPGETVIEPLYAKRESLTPAYDFETMLGGGRLRGWKVEAADAEETGRALDALWETCGDLFLAVGDGNHSLAAARAYWLEIRDSVPEEQRANHPARFALAEIENLHSPAIRFEPIHRVLTNVDPQAFLREFEAVAPAAKDGGTTFVSADREARFDIPLRELQSFLDAYLAAHPETGIDYIHGDETLRSLAVQPNALGFMPEAFRKADLFPYIREFGVLPRKTFSMGHANEKRYYFEARRI